MTHLCSEQPFCGRKKTLALLRRRVLDLKEGYRQNLALLGTRYVGKSSIFRYFLANLDDQHITTIYLDLENRDFHYFYSKFITSLLYNYAKSQKLEVHEDILRLCESTRGFIPHTVAVIDKIMEDYKKRRYQQTFLGLMALPEIFTNETRQFCVLLFDEFQQLETFQIADAFQIVGKKIMTQKRCLYFVSSSFEKEALKILSEKLSLLFGNFEMIKVQPLGFESGSELIEGHLKDVKIGNQLRNFLIDYTGGHPLYLTLLARELNNLSALHKQSEIYKPLLMQAIENAIFDQWGVISRHFELIINDISSGKGNAAMTLILCELAKGHNKISQLEERLEMKKQAITQRMNRLIDNEIVVRNGNFFYVKDRLFKYWLKYVYKVRLCSLDLNFDVQKRSFKDELMNAIEVFNASSRRDFSSRIVELLHCFDNEAFDLNGRKYKLPLFQKLDAQRVRSDNGTFFDLIRAQTDDEDWVIVPKKENFAEADLATLKREFKRNGEKPKRFVIISLTDLDSNTRLRALQEKYWIWSQNELRTLLTLFDKPLIT